MDGFILYKILLCDLMKLCHGTVRSFYKRTKVGYHFDFKGCSCSRFTGEVYLDVLECRRVGLVGVDCAPVILGVEHRRRAKIKLQQLDIILLLVFGAGGCTHLLQGPGLLLIIAEGRSGQHFSTLPKVPPSL